MVVREYCFVLDYVDERSEIISPEKSLVMVGRLKKCGRTSGASWASILTGVDTSPGDFVSSTHKHRQASYFDFVVIQNAFLSLAFLLDYYSQSPHAHLTL
jgi:hypothetical protein